SKLVGTPDLMPVLSAGKHRNPRQGACFMEFASFLAGERWSDHPACTHPLLAFLARGVNDFTTDAGRSRMVPLIPSVIGLSGSDPRIDLVIAVRAAANAIGVASEPRQRALATGLLTCRRMLVEFGMDTDGEVAQRISEALALAPLAWEWAKGFESLRGTRRRSLSFTRAGRAIVSTAVLGLAQACVDDTDDRLVAMLASAIDDTRAVVGASQDAQPQPQEARVFAL